MQDITTDMKVIHQNISVDPLLAPTGFHGSPLLSSLNQMEENIPIDSYVVVDYTSQSHSWPGLTLMFWLRFDDPELEQTRIPILVSKILEDIGD